MGGRLDFIKEIEQLFRQLLEVTDGISENLQGIRTVEDLDAVAAGLRRRDELIHAINALEAQEVPEACDPAEAQAYEKYRWLCREIAKKISWTDKENIEVMNAVLKGFMDSLRVSRQSIRTVNAYAAAQTKSDRQ